ncbi:hypothetical protein IMSHALPRED_010350 [Imshaugia aleurites]|uniref:Methyltransferase n=1 Tax=Imshaugia aleurites TaxID=172621 RepID=A0A8H3G0M5_9LECA|nr:hypothetical protein IMSHALPRED_010350 [Imshaugia aleurites]
MLFKTQSRSLLLRKTITLPHLPHSIRRGYPAAGNPHREPFEHVAGKVPPSTRATVRFHAGTTDNEPATIDFTPGRQHATNIRPNEEYIVNVTDIRDYDPPTTLAVEGCEWVHSPTALTEADLLENDREKVNLTVEGAYFQECAKLVQQRTNATRALAYNWRHRRLEKDLVPGGTVGLSGKPLATFHMDNDEETARMNLRRNLGDAEAERWLKKRWGIINVWRPIGDTVLQWPLGLLDSRDIKADQNTAPIFTRNNYKSHFSALKYSPGFKYYYVNQLTTDEALLFVDYDSAKSSQLSGLAHGAFQDHSTSDNAPLRRSIEVRVLVLWGDEA